jgi:hypothetical protein
LKFVARRKEPDMQLKTFMKAAGGVNACANLYAKHLGRTIGCLRSEANC